MQQSRAFDVEKQARKLASLIEDDRWAKNREKLADTHLSTVLNARERLDRVIAAMQGEKSSDTRA